MIKKNKAFILERPSHITAMTIWFSGVKDTVDNEEISKAIDKLKTKFDLYFIFSESLLGIIDLEKYSRLYQAKGYIVSENKDQCQAIWWTLKYLWSFMNSEYVGYYTIESGELPKLISQYDDMTRVSESPLNIGIMKYTRIPYSRIDSLCKIPRKKDLMFSWKYLSIDPRGMYCTHVTESSLIYLRPWVISKISDFMKNDVDYTITPGSLFLDSFRDFRFGDFIASWAEKTGKPEQFILNINLRDAKA